MMMVVMKMIIERKLIQQDLLITSCGQYLVKLTKIGQFFPVIRHFSISTIGRNKNDNEYWLVVLGGR